MSRYEPTDRVLWLLVPLALAASYYGSRHLLQNVNNATLTPVETAPSAKKVDDDAEAQIPASALLTLADGHSFELQRAAFKIVLNQSLKDAPRKLLLKDLAGRLPGRRENAVLALWYLVNGPDPKEFDYERIRYDQQLRLQNLQTYQAIVTALVNLLPLHARTTTEVFAEEDSLPPSPVRPLRRPSLEILLLKILLQLVRAFNRSPSTPEGGVPSCLEAGLIKHWLAKYPFPCTLPQFSKLNFKRCDVFDLLTDPKACSFDDALMSELFRQLLPHPEAQQQLRVCGLARRHSRLKEDFQQESATQYIVWNDAEGAAAATMAQQNRSGNANTNDAQSETSAWRSFHPPVRRQSADASEEELEQRRRHREAVVVSDRIIPMTSGSTNLRSVENASALLEGTSGAGVTEAGSDGDNDDDDNESAASWLSFSAMGDDDAGVNTPDSLPELLAPREGTRVSEVVRQLSVANVDGEGTTTTTRSATDLAGMAIVSRLRERFGGGSSEEQQRGEQR